MKKIEKVLDILENIMDRYVSLCGVGDLINEARAELDELKCNLKDIEQVYNEVDCSIGFHFCPACGHTHGEHGLNCWLNKAIRG